jgi:serine/threonine protein phosphatase PrpC
MTGSHINGRKDMPPEKIKHVLSAGVVVAMTHIGRIRENNEDRYLVKETDDRALLLAVADGMGGAEAGEVAAELVISELENIWVSSQDTEQLLTAIKTANKKIMKQVLACSDLLGMGTTVTAVLLWFTVKWNFQTSKLVTKLIILYSFC